MKNKRKRQKFFCAVYDRKNARHNFLFMLTVCALVISLFVFRAALCDDTYNYIAFEKDPYVWQSPHVKQFDAFLKGQLHLDVEANEKLLALENPYDPAARAEAGVQYLWDHAFYGGKYYSYFGAAPLIAVHAPIYFLTGGVPSDAYATMVLAVLVVIFIALALREAVLRFLSKANLWLFLSGLCAVTSVSGVYTAVFFADIYYVSAVSALCFTMAALFYALRAFRKSAKSSRRGCLFLCACSIGMAVLSRPTAALANAALLPFFAERIFCRERGNRRERLITASFFLLPLAAFACGVMWYNAARFSSPLDFGARWQLTVSDVSNNALDADFAFSSFFSYFIYPFWSAEGYPFIKMQCQLLLPDGARYVYGEVYAGAFALVLPAAVLIYPRLARAKREAGENCTLQSAFVGAALLACAAVAFADFCMAGVNMRYIYDIVPLLSVIGALVLLSLPSYFLGAKKAFFVMLCAASFALAVHASIAVIATFAP